MCDMDDERMNYGNDDEDRSEDDDFGLYDAFEDEVIEPGINDRQASRKGSKKFQLIAALLGAGIIIVFIALVIYSGMMQPQQVEVQTQVPAEVRAYHTLTAMAATGRSNTQAAINAINSSYTQTAIIATDFSNTQTAIIATGLSISKTVMAATVLSVTKTAIAEKLIIKEGDEMTTLDVPEVEGIGTPTITVTQLYTNTPSPTSTQSE